MGIRCEDHEAGRDNPSRLLVCMGYFSSCSTLFLSSTQTHLLATVLLSRPFLKKLETKTKTSVPWSWDQDQDLDTLVSRPRPRPWVLVLETKTFAQKSTIKFHFKCNKCSHTHSSTFCCTVQCTSNSLQYYTNQCPLSTACKLLSLSNIHQPL